MPNTWMNQNTLGDTRPDAQEKTPTSSTRQETKLSTRLLLTKQRHSVSVTLEKTIVLSGQSASGMQYRETNHTEYGVAFPIENAMR